MAATLNQDGWDYEAIGYGSPDDYRGRPPEHLQQWCPWCGDCLHCVGPGGSEHGACESGTDGMHYWPPRDDP